VKFTLFSIEPFNIKNPETLIESCCIQSDFYTSYDTVEGKDIKYINQIGARTKGNILSRCQQIIDTHHSEIFDCDLDTFLDLSHDRKKELIKDLDEKVISRLINISGIGISKTTKIFHTLYPEIFPMIDNALQDFYKTRVNPKWNPKSIYPLLFDFYENLCVEETRMNIDRLYEQLSHLKLTKIRIFDIVWWSYMKSISDKRKHIVWKIFN
jgi:hypothetical protein